MTTPLSAPDLFEQEFLQIRCKLIEVGAMLDRLDRADGNLDDDVRRALIRDACKVIQSDDSNRAEQLQQLFSDPYEDGWLDRFTPTR